MIETLLITLIILAIVNIVIGLKKKVSFDIKPQLKEVEESIFKFDTTLERTEKSIKDEFQRNRKETSETSQTNRGELTKSLKAFEDNFSENIKKLNDLLRQNFGDFNKQQIDLNKQATDNIKNVEKTIEKNLKSIREDNTIQLSEMRKTVDEKGKYIYDEEGNIETPLVNGKECVYVHYNLNGSLECGIEKAYNQGSITFKKPLSCHLYPIRVKQYSSFTAVNYHHWSICSDACSLGKELQKPLFEFVKEALIRRFGSAWYLQLEKVAKESKKK